MKDIAMIIQNTPLMNQAALPAARTNGAAPAEPRAVKMLDTSTGQLIRQYPSEEALAISRGIEQFQQGLLLKQKA
jgi:hypothetical protein